LIFAVGHLIAIVFLFHAIDQLAIRILELEIRFLRLQAVEKLSGPILDLHLILFLRFDLVEIVTIEIFYFYVAAIEFQLRYCLLACRLAARDGIEFVAVILLFQFEDRFAFGIKDLDVVGSTIIVPFRLTLWSLAAGHIFVLVMG